MIPKIIHYCWFGGNPLTELAQKCIESWKRYCPEYEIWRWDESNFDINFNAYVCEAYATKKWAFITDVVRLYALVRYGGIYMDTDVELVKPLDDFLQYDAFSGFESLTMIPTGIMASIKGHLLFKEFLDEYSGIHFLLPDHTYDMTTNVVRITRICEKYGFQANNTLQTIRRFTLFPKDFFCPKESLTWKINITENTCAIHHFDGSWLTDQDKYSRELKRRLKKYLPSRLSNYLATFYADIRYNGMLHAIRNIIKWINKVSI